MGRPAASPEVQRSGRSAPVRKSNVASFDACQPASVLRDCQNSYSLPVARIDHDDVAIARPLALQLLQRLARLRHRRRMLVLLHRPVLDRRIVRHGIRSRIRFRRILEQLHLHAPLIRRHDDESHIQVVLERLLRADTRDDGGGVGVDGKRRDVLIPRVVRRKHLQRRQNPSASGVSNITGFAIAGIGGRLRDCDCACAWPLRRARQWRAARTDAPLRSRCRSPRTRSASRASRH